MIGKLPFVSVIIATYNSKRSLINCIKSVESQNYVGKLEIVVVDDGSTDGTLETIRSRKWKKSVKILKQSRKGPAAARNLGARNARGVIFAFTDADCVAPRKWIGNIISTYRRFPEIVGIGGPLQPSKNNIFSALEIIKNKSLHKMRNKTIIGREEVPVGFTNNMSYKADIFHKFKGFDEYFDKPAGEDFDLKQRICKAGYKVAFTPNPILHMEDYDLGYMLRQILKRGTRKKLGEMSSSRMMLEVIKNLPEIILTLSKKTKGYRRAYEDENRTDK